MRRFNKVFNAKIVFITIGVMLLFAAPIYSSQHNLRLPIGKEDDTLAAIQKVMLSLDEEKELVGNKLLFRQRFRSAIDVKVTWFWTVTDKGWMLISVTVIDSQRKRWNLKLSDKSLQVGPVAGAYVTNIPNSNSLAIKEEIVPIAKILQLLNRVSRIELSSRAVAHGDSFRVPTYRFPIGPLGIQVTEDIYIVPDAIFEAARQSGIGGSDIGTVAVHVGSDATQVPPMNYKHFLKKLYGIDSLLYRKLVSQPEQGFTGFNKVYFTPGNILISASRVEEKDNLQKDLGHEFFERTLRSLGINQKKLLREAYHMFDRFPLFRRGNLLFFGHFSPYRKQIMQGSFAEEFWTWFAWPDFGDVQTDEQFTASIINFIERYKQAFPGNANKITEAQKILQVLQRQSREAVDIAIKDVISAINQAANIKDRLPRRIQRIGS